MSTSLFEDSEYYCLSTSQEPRGQQLNFEGSKGWDNKQRDKAMYDGRRVFFHLPQFLASSSSALLLTVNPIFCNLFSVNNRNIFMTQKRNK